MTYRKKLIEVALPLEAINRASVREKSISHGHPSTLHLWWARRPLATCRAVLFASLVDDPSEHPEEFPTEKAQEQERDRLFRLIEDLVQWENSNNKEVLAKVRAEILKSTGDNPPPVLDPFAGGGSIPLEAQRLGLEAHASDLNPVAVLINKALIEIPPKFSNSPPVNPEAKKSLMARDWHGAQGLADDIRYYGNWIRGEAERTIGYLYPKVILPREHGGGEAKIIAWLWVRTVRCPNPACGARMPLATSFWLSKKKGREAWVEPIINQTITPPKIDFVVKTGKIGPPEPSKVGRGTQFRCLCCGNIASEQYIKNEGTAKRLDAQLIATVADRKGGRIYLSPTSDQINLADQAKPVWKPEQELSGDRRAIWCPLYGLSTIGDLFSARQLVALSTFSGLVDEARTLVVNHADGDTAYADAIATYLGMNVSRLANRCSTICFWDSSSEKIQQVFARQGIPMVWDFVEGNPFSDSTGNFMGQLDYMIRVIEQSHCEIKGEAKQLDAMSSLNAAAQFMISTDPPYYDNIGYAVM